MSASEEPNEALRASQTVHELAKHYFRTGHYEKALSIFQSMADSERKLAEVTGNNIEWAQLLVDCGTTLSAISAREASRRRGGGAPQRRRAESLLETGVAMLGKQCDANDPRLSVPLSNLAECKRRAGKLREACDGFARSIDVAQRAALVRPRTSGPAACDSQTSWCGLSASLRAMRHHQRADEALHNAIARNTGVAFPARPGRFLPNEVPDDELLPRVGGPARSFLRVRQHTGALPTALNQRKARTAQCKADESRATPLPMRRTERRDRVRAERAKEMRKTWAAECRAARKKKADALQAERNAERKRAKRAAVKALRKTMASRMRRRFTQLDDGGREVYEEEIQQKIAEHDAIEWRTGVRPTEPIPTAWELFQNDQDQELAEAEAFFASRGFPNEIQWEYLWDPQHGCHRKRPRKRAAKTETEAGAGEGAKEEAEVEMGAAPPGTEARAGAPGTAT